MLLGAIGSPKGGVQDGLIVFSPMVQELLNIE
jgi:hypothetical protein